MKSLREQFEDDYMAVSMPANNRKGFKIQYIYSAPWYLWDMPESVLKQKKLLLTGVSVGSLFLFLLIGIQRSGLNSYILVELAGTFALCFHVLELFSIFQFLFTKYRTSRLTYSNIDRILSSVPFIRGICLVSAVVASVYYMLQNTFCWLTVFVAAGYLICALMALFIFIEYKKIPFRTEKNTCTEIKDKAFEGTS